MRKHRAPLGWPRRDPRHYRFAVPNEVWEYKLRPTEFLILSYLCYRLTHDRGRKTISSQTVADSLRLTATTVEKRLTALAGKGLVTEDGALTLDCEAGKFFSLPNEVFLLALPPSAFLAYAYLLYCEDRRTHQCHPSYRTIAWATGLSLNTVVKSVSMLAEKSLIAVERSCWFNEQGMKRNGNNVYTILPTRTAVEDVHQRQLRQLELDAQHRRALQRQENKARRPPHNGPVCPSQLYRGVRRPRPTCEGRKEAVWMKGRRKPTTSPRSVGINLSTPSPRPSLPTYRWGKQSVWLAAGGSRTLFCGLTPTPTDREGGSSLSCFPL